VVDQIVPGCSVKRRKSTQCRAARAPHDPPHGRQPGGDSAVSQQRTKRAPVDAAASRSYRREQQPAPAAATRLEAAFTTPPLQVSGQREGGRTPPRARHRARPSFDGEQQTRQGGVAEQRHRRSAVNKRHTGLSSTSSPATTCPPPRGSRSVRRAAAVTHTATAKQRPSHRRCTSPGRAQHPTRSEERAHREQIAADWPP